jgi:hypothetical protein
MKHIKPFNEAKDNWFNIKAGDVLDFANNSHLVYLLDDGYIYDNKANKVKLGRGDCVAEVNWIKIQKRFNFSI